LEPGEKFGKFEILETLGQGAMGEVYKARDPLLDRDVALKVVSPSLLKGKDTLERFKREARAAARLQHPNIVTIFEVGEVEGKRYIAMEYVGGEELGAAFHDPDRFTLEQKIRMMVDVCRGLDFAHKMGVIHRDVKPPNIRVTPERVVKILDFGIAKATREADLTQTGIVLGTPSYISPELLQGAKVDHRADMWAVGVILYEVLSGHRPFQAKTIASLIHEIITKPLPPLDARRLGLPEPLVAAVTKALDKRPEGRFKDLHEMERALLSAIGSTPPPEEPLDPVARRRGYELNFAEARRLLADEDYSGALEAARRAQVLEPTRTGIVKLVRVIEARLAAATTVRRATSPVATTSRSVGSKATPTPASGIPLALGPLDSATLRTHGAGALTDKGAFGEPPATRQVSLSPVADLLAVAGADGAIRLWDLRSRTRSAILRTALHQRTGHDAAALALDFSPDGSLLASGHVDGSVHLWDMARGEAVPVRMRHDDGVSAVAFSPDSATLATGSLDSNLRLWDVGAALGGDARRELLRQPAAVTALAWTGGGEWILTGHSSRVLRLIDPQRARLLATIRGPAAQVTQLVLSPDGQHMAVASRDRTVRLVDLASREETATLALPRPATSVCFLADGAFLATVGLDNAVRLWDIENRAASAALWGPSDESFVGVALYGEWNHLAVALADGRIRLWGPTT
jgi:WD40 repeat protein/tRNA A-37 threonylcarbamoyl transferase component Bud32